MKYLQIDGIRSEIEKINSKREDIIIKSREILKLSKGAIYSVHRNDMKEADFKISEAKKIITELKKKINVESRFESASFGPALEEYAEAVLYYHFIKQKKLVLHTSVGVPIREYLLGLSDLTGELARKAVHTAVIEDYEFVRVIGEFLNEIYQLFIELDIHDSELRRKADAVKWNLRKVEDIIYDIKLKKVNSNAD